MDLPNTEQYKKSITFTEFLDHCVACGGNWTAMFLSGIKEVYPDYYKQMPERTYEYAEVVQLMKDLGVILEK